jgi:hypothetical protein
VSLDPSNQNEAPIRPLPALASMTRPLLLAKGKKRQQSMASEDRGASRQFEEAE